MEMGERGGAGLQGTGGEGEYVLCVCQRERPHVGG